MGTYINPGNEGFMRIVADRYVDKTGFLTLVNRVINTSRNLICVTRPRRFGKSFAAEAASAYFSCGCDSSALFQGLEISADSTFAEHLNAYHVVRIDMASFKSDRSSEAVLALTDALLNELRSEFVYTKYISTLNEALLSVVRTSKRKFIFVIDEWDAPIRNATQDAQAGRDYIEFLRMLFKNANFTAEAVAAAYLTGILPIKHYGTQSALNDFREFTMLDCAQYAPYVGFMQDEVEQLCTEFNMDISELRQWYDGYELPGAGSVFAPYSVIESCQRGRVGRYWTSSEAFDILRDYIDLDFDNLQADIVRAIGGAHIAVDPSMFQNDMREIHSKDDALTLLIHLGYLTYNADTGQAQVPNEEVRLELSNALRQSRHTEVARIVKESDQLLANVLAGNADAVAQGIAHAHDVSCSPIHYNDEQALRAVVKAALISAAEDYIRIDELPSGHGFADIAYIPKPKSSKPALVVELKWSQPAETAVNQIRNKHYPAVLQNLNVPILLVGVSYDKDTKLHTCKIEYLE